MEEAIRALYLEFAKENKKHCALPLRGRAFFFVDILEALSIIKA